MRIFRKYKFPNICFDAAAYRYKTYGYLKDYWLKKAIIFLKLFFKHIVKSFKILVFL